MRILLAAVLIAALPTATLAQTQSATPIRPVASKLDDASLYSGSLGDFYPSDRLSDGQQRTCLTRKTTRIVECHTFAEWQKIAGISKP